MNHHSIILALFTWLLCSGSRLHAQEERLITTIGNSLVEVRPGSNDIIEINNIDKPGSVRIRSLVFNEHLCLFYGVINITREPTLINMSLTGEYKEIGPISVPGATVFLCEGLTYDPSTQKLFASVSMDNSIQEDDFFSETLIEINPGNAQAAVLTTVMTGVPNPDMDDIEIVGNTMYLADGEPNEFTKFFSLDMTNPGPVSTAQEILSTSYLAIRDFAALDGVLYFAGNRELYGFNINGATLNTLGSTHGADEFSGALLEGMTAVPASYFSVNPNIVGISEGCLGAPITITLDNPDGQTIWNTGMIGPSLEVLQNGVYSAEIFIDNCIFPSDTIEVGFRRMRSLWPAGEHP